MSTIVTDSIVNMLPYVNYKLIDGKGNKRQVPSGTAAGGTSDLA
jgi:hypothetical protein